jgi:hypothetical protein
MAVAVWDWFVCFKGQFGIIPRIQGDSKEVVEWKQIWQRHWSPIKVLYIWTRYYGIACFALNLWLFNAELTIERCKTL